MNERPLASYIDHTLLKPTATAADIEWLCAEAMRFQCFSVCVNSCWVSLATRALEGSPLKVCTVAGFPLGATSTTSKLREVERALTDGANEIDMVINVGWVKGSLYREAEREIEAIARLVHAGEGLLKVIVETGLLSADEKRTVCRLVERGGADFIKTCTGFSEGRATTQDIELFREHLPPKVQIKASAGIKDSATAWALIRAGASRLGTSSTASVLGLGEKGEGY